MRLRSWGAAILCATAAASACATICPQQPSLQQASPDSAVVSAHTPAGKLASAQALVAEGKYEDAAEIFQIIQKEYPGTDWAARAKYALAVSYLSPDNRDRDMNMALYELDLYVAEYPKHEHVLEARIWRSAIKQLLDAKKENDRLHKNIEKLKLLDVKQEEKRLGR